MSTSFGKDEKLFGFNFLGLLLFSTLKRIALKVLITQVSNVQKYLSAKYILRKSHRFKKQKIFAEN